MCSIGLSVANGELKHTQKDGWHIANGDTDEVFAAQNASQEMAVVVQELLDGTKSPHAEHLAPRRTKEGHVDIIGGGGVLGGYQQACCVGASYEGPFASRFFSRCEVLGLVVLCIVVLPHHAPIVV